MESGSKVFSFAGDVETTTKKIKKKKKKNDFWDNGRKPVLNEKNDDDGRLC